MNDTIIINGWSSLEIHTAANFSDFAQAYAAGLLEGSLTAHRTAQGFYNTVNVTAVTANAPLLAFINKNFQWIDTQIASPPKGEESYWRHMSLVLHQLHGLADGYAQGKDPSSPAYAYFDFLIMQLSFDLGDISTAVSPSHPHNARSSMAEFVSGRGLREEFRQGEHGLQCVCVAGAQVVRWSYMR